MAETAHAARKLGLIAGAGALPGLLAAAASTRYPSLFIVGFRGHTQESTISAYPHCLLQLEEIVRCLEIFKEQGVTDVLMAGKLSRPPLKALKPPALAARIVAQLGKALFSGDDALFTAITRLFEEEGFAVIGADDLLEDLLMPAGLLSAAKPNTAALRDIARGREVLRILGALDIGQAVIVKEGLVLGVEALEGTDALIERCAALHDRATPGGVLVKASKPQQERRVDLPAIGPETLRRMAEAGFAGVAAEASGALLIGREECIALAEAQGLFLLGFGHDAE